MVITPTINGREHLLQECGESVAAQSYPVSHYIQKDNSHHGPALVRNSLVGQTSSDWVLPVDDDDLLDPGCVATLVAHSDGADVVYPWCRMVGRTDQWVPNKLFCESSLYRQPFIPIVMLIRRPLFEMLGGFRNVRMEDWDFQIRALQHGARFRCVPIPLWSYRFGVNQFQAEAA